MSGVTILPKWSPDAIGILIFQALNETTGVRCYRRLWFSIIGSAGKADALAAGKEYVSKTDGEVITRYRIFKITRWRVENGKLFLGNELTDIAATEIVGNDVGYMVCKNAIASFLPTRFFNASRLKTELMDDFRHYLQKVVSPKKFNVDFVFSSHLKYASTFIESCGLPKPVRLTDALNLPNIDNPPFNVKDRLVCFFQTLTEDITLYGLICEKEKLGTRFIKKHAQKYIVVDKWL